MHNHMTRRFYNEQQPAGQVRHACHSSTRRQGQAIVEFAVVVPVLLALLLGVIEFGWLIKNNHSVANATREGARFAALGKTPTEVRTRVKFCAAPLTVTDSNITLQYYNTASSTWVSWPADGSDGKNGVPVDSQVKVTVIVKHQQLTNFFSFLKNRYINQLTVMRREL
jgi:Flp pilus assembly protein TadG